MSEELHSTTRPTRDGNDDHTFYLPNYPGLKYAFDLLTFDFYFVLDPDLYFYFSDSYRHLAVVCFSDF